MTEPEDLERIMSEMSEEEMRAKAEAAQIGQLHIVETVLAALILQVPHPDLIEQAIAIRLDELRKAKPVHPDLAWEPPTTSAGAQAAAARILQHWHHMKPKAKN